MNGDNNCAPARLLTVIDARSFLDEWENPDPFPPLVLEAAKTDARAHLRGQKACEALAEHVERPT